MSRRRLATAWRWMALAVWLAGCNTPRAHTYVTFEEAYAEAARVANEWDPNAVISTARAYTAIGRGDSIVPRVDGQAAAWWFAVVTPNRQSGVGVFDGHAGTVHLGEKGGQMICVGQSWFPAPAATEEVLKRGSSACLDPLPVADMAIRPQELLHLAQVIERARNAGYDTLLLSDVQLERNIWTITFEEDLVRIGDRFVHVQVDAKAGTILSVSDSAAKITPLPDPD